MSQEPLHWSERAKVQPPGATGPQKPDRGTQRPSDGGSPSPFRDSSPRPPGVRPVFWIVLAAVVCVAAGVAAVFFWPSDSQDPGTRDASAAALATTTTAAPPALGASYLSSTLGCSFSYPVSWVEYPPQTESGNLVNDPTAYLVGDPATTDASDAPTESVMFIGRRWPDEVPPSARSVVDAMITDFDAVASAPDASYALYEPATELLVNGMQACSWASRDNRLADPRVTKTVVITSGDGSYVFEFRCVESRLPEAQSIFDAILVSFTPGD